VGNDSYVIRQERCPRCAKLGKDTSHDNLAVYSDGHSYCFSCGNVHKRTNKIQTFQERNKENIEEKMTTQVHMPPDCNMDYPKKALDWIYHYELNRNDLVKNNTLWSDSLQRLIFPIYKEGRLVAWQGRSFNLTRNALMKVPKWYGQGNLKETFNVIGAGDKIVLVEDIISAIKVAKCGVMSLPLYGSFIGTERFKTIHNRFGDTVEVCVWLDPDKRAESVSEARMGRLMGLRCRVILDKSDPKDVNYDTIKYLLTKS
jgi:hypothetical protein